MPILSSSQKINMPYAILKKLKAYKLAHSRLPSQRAKQAARRKLSGYKKYMRVIQRRNLMKRYGITPEDYINLLKNQRNTCAVCETTRPNNGVGDRYFDVDHDHKTGTVRGLLCRQCNLLVGLFERGEDKWGKIRKYLSKYNHYPKEK